MISFRYLTWELLSRVFLTLFSLYAILLVSQILRISVLISSFGFSFSNIVLPLFYISITHLATLIPIAYFLAVLMTTLKLSETEELIALLSTGKSLLNVAKPFMVLGFFFFFLCLFSANYLESFGKKSLIKFVEGKALEKIKSVLEQKMEEDVFTEIFRDYYLYADKISLDKKKYEKIVLVPKHNREGSNSFFISAKRGESLEVEGSKSVLLKFYDGTLYKLSSQSETGLFAMSFEEFQIDFFTGIYSQIGSDKNYSDKTKSISSYEIYQKIKNNKMVDKTESNKLRYLLYYRIFSPILVLVFCFLGVFLGVYNVRREQNSVYFYFFLVLFLSQGASRILQWICERGLTSPELIVPLFYSLLLLGSFGVLYKKNKQALWEPLKIFSRKKSY